MRFKSLSRLLTVVISGGPPAAAPAPAHLVTELPLLAPIPGAGGFTTEELLLLALPAAPAAAASPGLTGENKPSLPFPAGAGE
jgi:hypothetical protein